MRANFKNFHIAQWCGNFGNLLSRIFSKNFVKATFLLKKLLNSWFDEIFFRWEQICHFTTLWLCNCILFADREQCGILASGNHHFCCPTKHYVHKHWKLPSHPQPPISMMTSGPSTTTMHPHSHFCPHLHLVCVCVYVYLVVCVSNAIRLILFTTTSKTASSS